MAFNFIWKTKIPNHSKLFTLKCNPGESRQYGEFLITFPNVNIPISHHGGVFKMLINIVLLPNCIPLGKQDSLL